jgi:hypothetical protein
MGTLTTTFVNPSQRKDWLLNRHLVIGEEVIMADAKRPKLTWQEED